METIKTITISAKCSDMFSAVALNSDGKCVGDYDGYVPEMMGKDSDGDYLCFNIDIKTGRILNWTPPSQAALCKTFGLTKSCYSFAKSTKYSFIVDSEYNASIVWAIISLASRKADKNATGLLEKANLISFNNRAIVDAWLKTVGNQCHLHVVVRNGEVVDLIIGNKECHYTDVQELTLLEAIETLQRL